MILAGDVGGTKVILALIDPDAGATAIVAEQRFETDEYDSLEAIVRTFLSAGTAPGRADPPRGSFVDRACFGIACPIVDGECRMTNLPWTLDRRSLAETLMIDQVAFINDLEATAYGVDALGEDRIATLAGGDPRGPYRRDPGRRDRPGGCDPDARGTTLV